jgi:hypothetical protein
MNSFSRLSRGDFAEYSASLVKKNRATSLSALLKEMAFGGKI